ncbi:hypothetical protein VQ042_11870 [Aurantimonas sp. A2-1-M11]|uniref:hypothetical protein n=1 Tax=Aurantimonas sp. A2-1-M11 TaxID=3113712 RepID=UPI002F928037
METVDLLFFVGVALAIGIILRPEVALVGMGAVTLIGSPFLVSVSPYGIIAAIPIFLVGALLIGFGDLIKSSRNSQELRTQHHEELMRHLRRQGEAPPHERTERRGRLTQPTGGL